MNRIVLNIDVENSDSRSHVLTYNGVEFVIQLENVPEDQSLLINELRNGKHDALRAADNAVYDLRNAQERIGELEGRLRVLSGDDGHVRATIKSLVATGVFCRDNKIRAIQYVRGMTQLSLKEAKMLVDEYIPVS